MNVASAWVSSVAPAIAVAVAHGLWLAAAAAAAFALVRRYGGLDARGRYGIGMALLASLPCAVVAIALAEIDGVSSLAPGTPLDVEVIGRGGAALVTDPPAAVESAGAADPASWLRAAIPVVVAAAWLVGFVVVCLRTVAGATFARLLVKWQAEPLPAGWVARAKEIARELGLAEGVRFVGTRASSVPFTIGWLSPIVVLPLSALSGLPPATLDLLLRHELSHVARRDYLLQLVQCAAEAVLFYHPLVWWLSREIRHERELACDEEVVSLGADPVAYARALTDLESLRGDLPPLALGAAPQRDSHSPGGSLKMRVLSIIQPSPHRPRRAAGMAALLTSSILGASVFIACGHVDGDESIDSPAPATEGNATGAAIVGDPAADGITIEWLPAKVERHRAAIEAASAATRVDPNVVALMVLVESGGDERATSPYGARGLLQLMPETATKVAARTGIALDHPDALFDPETNLQLGTALLAELLASDMVRAGAAAKSTAPREIAWAAYNAGNRAVREHLELGHPLPEEAQGYVALLGSLYAERDEPESASYDAWRARTER